MSDERDAAIVDRTVDSAVQIRQLSSEGPVVLFFVPDVVSPSSLAKIESFNLRLSEFSRRGAMLRGLVTASPQEVMDLRSERSLRVALVADPDGEIAQSLGIDAADQDRDATVVLLELNFTATSLADTPREHQAQQALAFLDAHPARQQ